MVVPATPWKIRELRRKEAKERDKRYISHLEREIQCLHQQLCEWSVWWEVNHKPCEISNPENCTRERQAAEADPAGTEHSKRKRKRKSRKQSSTSQPLQWDDVKSHQGHEDEESANKEFYDKLIETIDMDSTSQLFFAQLCRGVNAKDVQCELGEKGGHRYPDADFIWELQLHMDAACRFTQDAFAEHYKAVQVACMDLPEARLREWLQSSRQAVKGLSRALEQLWAGHCQGAWKTDYIITVRMLWKLPWIGTMRSRSNNYTTDSWQ